MPVKLLYFLPIFFICGLRLVPLMLFCVFCITGNTLFVKYHEIRIYLKNVETSLEFLKDYRSKLDTKQPKIYMNAPDSSLVYPVYNIKGRNSVNLIIAQCTILQYLYFTVFQLHRQGLTQRNTNAYHTFTKKHNVDLQDHQSLT